MHQPHIKLCHVLRNLHAGNHDDEERELPLLARALRSAAALRLGLGYGPASRAAAAAGVVSPGGPGFSSASRPAVEGTGVDPSGGLDLSSVSRSAARFENPYVHAPTSRNSLPDLFSYSTPHPIAQPAMPSAAQLQQPGLQPQAQQQRDEGATRMAAERGAGFASSAAAAAAQQEETPQPSPYLQHLLRLSGGVDHANDSDQVLDDRSNGRNSGGTNAARGEDDDVLRLPGAEEGAVDGVDDGSLYAAMQRATTWLERHEL